MMVQSTPTLRAQCVAELIGTFLLVFFGCGAVHAAVLTGAQSGIWQIAIVWGIVITLAIYLVGGISGAHLNPAITLAMLAWGQFAPRKVFPYLVSQFVGAFVAAAVLFLLYAGPLESHENEKKVVRGSSGSVLTAMCYGEYFPNPGVPRHADLYLQQDQDALRRAVSPLAAALAETLGTMILALVVFGLTDRTNRGAPPEYLAPVYIGLTVAILISVIAPLTQACFNPARDFGPRLFAYCAGWGTVALPGPNGWHVFTVYLFAPLLGAVLGGGVYRFLLRPGFGSDNQSSS